MVKSDITFNIGLVVGKIDGILSKLNIKDETLFRDIEEMKNILIVTKDLVIESELESD